MYARFWGNLSIEAHRALATAALVLARIVPGHTSTIFALPRTAPSAFALPVVSSTGNSSLASTRTDMRHLQNILALGKLKFCV